MILILFSLGVAGDHFIKIDSAHRAETAQHTQYRMLRHRKCVFLRNHFGQPP
ncbi:hypothetical protein EVA_09506 [gut metagenome]|uniref:Uncharacterized protein n=1 Tax=gut metagenome TaxID=749906 RepID=J9CQH2_9ZZZZ